MKKTDWAMVILIASVSVLIAYFVDNAIPALKSGEGKPVKVKMATPINSEVPEPDPEVFNKDAINPTIEVTVGDK